MLRKSTRRSTTRSITFNTTCKLPASPVEVAKLTQSYNSLYCTLLRDRWMQHDDFKWIHGYRMSRQTRREVIN